MYYDKHNMQIFGVIPFTKLQNDIFPSTGQDKNR